VNRIEEYFGQASAPASGLRKGAVAEEQPPRLPFPVECLPSAAKNMVLAIAEATRVPITLAACCILGIISACLGAGLQVWSGKNRKTRGNLYIMASAESGSGKSETFRHAAKPLYDREREIIALWRKSEYPQLDAEREVLEGEIDHLNKSIRNGKIPRDVAIAEIRDKKVRLAEIEDRLKEPVLSVEDATREKLASLLDRPGECLASLSSDAGAIVNNLLGRYNKLDRTDDDIYLKGYSGDACRFHRINRVQVVLNHPCIAALWLVQPDKVETMLAERSLTDGGLMPRILVCHTNAMMVPITGTEPCIPPEVETAWHHLIRTGIETFHNAAKPTTIESTENGHLAMREHYNGIAQRAQSELKDVVSFACRWTEQAWRISVCLHFAQHGTIAADTGLGLETAQSAIKIADWFAGEQLSILAAGRGAARENLQQEVVKLLEHLPEGITARDLYRKLPRLTPEEAERLLDEMVDAGQLTARDIRPEHGGHPSRLYMPTRR